MAAVLRKDHTLKGTSCYPVVKAVRGFTGTLPDPLARLKKDHPLEAYSETELVQQLEGVMGMDATELLDMAGVEGATNPVEVDKPVLLFALHTAIVEANAQGQPKGVALQQDPPPEQASASGDSKGSKQAAQGSSNIRKVRPVLVLCAY